jgi:hypothetical protein
MFYIQTDRNMILRQENRGRLSIYDIMSACDRSLEDLSEAVMEDAWYELEGAYEVYGIGRCRFVLLHCRMALMIGISLLARRKGVPLPERSMEEMAGLLGMPGDLIDSYTDVDHSGSYPSILKRREDEQQHAATVLAKTLEVFEWIKVKMDEG